MFVVDSMSCNHETGCGTVSPHQWLQSSGFVVNRVWNIYRKLICPQLTGHLRAMLCTSLSGITRLYTFTTQYCTTIFKKDCTPNFLAISKVVISTVLGALHAFLSISWSRLNNWYNQNIHGFVVGLDNLAVLPLLLLQGTLTFKLPVFGVDWSYIVIFAFGRNIITCFYSLDNIFSNI